MALEIDYIPFATGGGANVMPQATYAADAPDGVVPGLADPTYANKAWRQSSMIAAAVANFIANTLNVNVIDDGNLTTLITNLTDAIEAASGSTPRGSFKNLVGQTTSNTARSWTADALVVANSSGNAKLLTNVSVSYATGTTGANGYDGNGALGTSQWLYDFVIWNPTTSTTAALCSHSATAPTLPSGYTYFARVGACYLDSSGNLMRVLQKGNKAQFQVTSATNTAALPSLVAGAIGSVTTPTYSAVSLAALVPPTATEISVSVLNNATTNDLGIYAPNSSYGASGSISNPPLASFGGNATAAGTGTNFEMLLENASIYVAQQSAAYSFVTGWKDDIQ